MTVPSKPFLPTPSPKGETDIFIFCFPGKYWLDCVFSKDGVYTICFEREREGRREGRKEGGGLVLNFLSPPFSLRATQKSDSREFRSGLRIVVPEGFFKK